MLVLAARLIAPNVSASRSIGDPARPSSSEKESQSTREETSVSSGRTNASQTSRFLRDRGRFTDPSSRSTETLSNISPASSRAAVSPRPGPEGSAYESPAPAPSRATFPSLRTTSEIHGSSGPASPPRFSSSLRKPSARSSWLASTGLRS